MGIGKILRGDKTEKTAVNMKKGEPKRSEAKIVKVKPAANVLCQSNETERLIQQWMESMGWQYKDFESILRDAGLTMPVSLSLPSGNAFSGYDGRYREECEFGFALFKEQIAIVKQFFGREIDENKNYRIRPRRQDEDATDSPEIELISTTYKWQNKTIEEEPFGKWTLKLLSKDSIYNMRLEVRTSIITGSQERLEEKRKQIIYYLLKDVDSEEIVKYLENISKILGQPADISISYVEEREDKDVIIKEIKTSEGKMQEYSTMYGENMAYHFYPDGRWECKNVSSDQKIVYVPQRGYGIEFHGPDNVIISEISNISEIIDMVSDTASKLWYKLQKEMR